MSSDDESGTAGGAAGGAAGGDLHKTKHYAWAAQNAARKAELAALGVDTTPKAIATGVASPPPTGSSGGASAWNAAGTWEEKDLTKVGIAALRSRLLEFSHAAGGKTVAISGVTKCEGEVRRIIARGKPRLGFELEIGASWEVRDGAAAGGGVLASGSLTIGEAADTDADLFDRLEVRVASTSGIPGSEATALVKLLDEPLRDLLRAWAEATKTA